MRILKHGKLKSQYFTCYRCGCGFVTNELEYQIMKIDGRILWYYAKCPECGMYATDSRIWEEADGE